MGQPMRKLIVVALLLFASVPALAYRPCEECPKNAGCTEQEPAGDGCNRATFRVWCEDGKWYRGDSFAFTLAYCPPKDWPSSYPWTPPEEKK